MNLEMGSHRFNDVSIPLLWGSRAVVEDRVSRISVIDLSGQDARPEIVGDAPADGIGFEPTFDGFTIIREKKKIYSYSPQVKLLVSLSLGLPDCQILPDGIRIGTNMISGSMFGSVEVGIVVTEDSIRLGGSLPPNLARLLVR